MKIRQFIVLCILIVIGFCLIWYKIDIIDKESDERYRYIEFMIKGIDKDVYDTNTAINGSIMKMIRDMYNKK